MTNIHRHNMKILYLLLNFNSESQVGRFYCNRKDVKTWDPSSSTWIFSLTLADKRI